MIKVGMADLSLDNWHTNHYPSYLRDTAKKMGLEIDLCYAWGQKEPEEPWKLTNRAWCEENDCEFCADYEELLTKADAIMVMCADDCRPHEELATPIFAGGKPVYCDKTFAPDVGSAKRMFAVAKANHAPIFSCSAQRFCPQLLSFREDMEKAEFAASQGPGDLVNYSVHQFEMLQAAMGTGVTCCQAYVEGEIRHIVYRYSDDRMCTFTQAPGLPFSFVAGTKEKGIKRIAVEQYYESFMQALLLFFETGIAPVSEKDTMEIMYMQQMARTAVRKPGTWVKRQEE